MAGKGGRQAGQAAQDRKLTELWNSGLVIRAIAEEMKFAAATSVTHAAKRLGLPSRCGNRNTKAATEANRERWKANKAEQRRKLKEAEALFVQIEIKNVEPVERHTCFVCGGKSLTWDGHPQCRGVGRRAA